jgi:hypothetical protein
MEPYGPPRGLTILAVADRPGRASPGSNRSRRFAALLRHSTKVIHFRSEFVRRHVTVITYLVAQSLYSKTDDVETCAMVGVCGLILVTGHLGSTDTPQ